MNEYLDTIERALLNARFIDNSNWIPAALVALAELRNHIPKLLELARAAKDISECGVHDIDPRMKYIEVQVSREDWARLRDALEALEGK